MRFSLENPFTKMTLLVFVAVLLLTVGGWITAVNTETYICRSWPGCFPQDAAGWSQLLHRIAAGLAAVLIVVMLRMAWRTQRDQRVLLPLATVTVILFFAQVFLGAVQVVRGFPFYLQVMHTMTGIVLWLALVGLAAASGILAGDTVDFPPLGIRQRAQDFLSLAKPLIVALLLATTYAGMVAGARGLPSPELTFWTLLGGALAAGGASALNQYIDRDLDKNMQRTSKRPLAAGRMLPAEGLSFGLALCILSFYLLAGYVNLLSAFLSLAGILYYVVLYSILLKKATIQNIVIGGGAGAIPPVVGWAAATGGLGLSALFLFAIVFLWTPPHFWALALVRRKDYARAGVPMLPVVRGQAETRRQIFIYTLELVVLTILMPVLNLTGSIFLVSAVSLGGVLLYAAWRVFRQGGNRLAWKMYRFSSMYLLFIFLALALDAALIS